MSLVQTNERMPIDEWLMRMAKCAAKRSSWPGTKVGCVVARNGRIVSTGYNGTPKGWTNNLARDMKNWYCHAEENAIAQAARFGISLEGCIFYTTMSPCVTCARMMVNAGIKELIWETKWEKHDTMMEEIYQTLGIPIRTILIAD